MTPERPAGHTLEESFRRLPRARRPAITTGTREQQTSTNERRIPDLGRFIPALRWLPNYNVQRNFGTDLSSGIILAVLIIPQSMAVALLAGLPPIYGLYASTVPTLLYALFGSSRHLNIGPMAIVALLTFAGVANLATPGSQEYIGLVLLLALMTGVFQVLLGALRAGFIVKFFSHAVISGFMAASAIIIATSQLDNLLGQNLDTDQPVYRIYAEAWRERGQIDTETALIGLGSVAVLLAYRFVVPRLPRSLILLISKFPAQLILVAAGTILAWQLGLHDRGVDIVGDIPRGLPRPTLPEVTSEALVKLMPAVVSITLIGYIEAVSVGKTIAAREKERIDSNQELTALGLANVSAAFFSGFPVSASLSRTAVNYQSGARSQVSSMIGAFLIVLTLLFLTPLFYYLPKAVLAAIIMVAVSGLITTREIRRYYQIRRLDGITLALTFIATLALGVEYGILIGVVFSLLVFIWHSADAQPVEVGYLESQGAFRSLARFPEGRIYEGTLILRIDAPLYFANVEMLERNIEAAVTSRPNLTHIILNCTGVADIDAVAVEMFEGMIRNYKAAGIQILFAGVRGNVRDVLARAGWDRRFPDVIQYPTVQIALESIGLMNRFTTMGPYQRIGIFGVVPEEDVLPSTTEDEEDGE